MGISFPDCRHAGEVSFGNVRQCQSPRLTGLKAVSADFCRGCGVRDHDPVDPAAPSPVLLQPCFHLGPALKESAADGNGRVDAGARSTGNGALFVCRHPAYGRTTVAQCRECPDYLFPVLSPRMPIEDVLRIRAEPPHAQPDGWWEWPNVREAEREAAARFIRRIPAYAGGYEGRGIVIAGGGRYLASAYVTIRVLRHVGCGLPIELWHLPGEVDDEMRAILAPYGVVCKCCDEVALDTPFRFVHGHWWKGWQIKCYAIVHSPFREVLYLDADSYPVRDPEFLFDWEGYRRHGAIFWPDTIASLGLFGPAHCHIFGIEPISEMPTESGQMVIDKRRCWRELNLALFYNARADYTYKVLWGDKDTFTVAWKRLGCKAARMWPRCDLESHSLLQYDDRGEVLFQHRALNKLTLESTSFESTPQPGGGNHFLPALRHERFCHQALDELRRTWRSWWDRLAAAWHPDDPYRPTHQFRRYYQVKYDVARRIAPRSICEIGVRAGYSAFAFLSAAPQAEYLGLDIDGTDHGGERGFFDYARGVLAGFRATLTRADTQQLDRLPGRYDLVHVDGDHSQAGCRHDLELACRAAPHVLVDDCDFIPEVRRACDEFAVAHPELSVEYIDDGARGSLVFAARSDQSGRNR